LKNVGDPNNIVWKTKNWYISQNNSFVFHRKNKKNKKAKSYSFGTALGGNDFSFLLTMTN